MSTLSIDDVPLNFVNCAKILGIWLQDDLKWNKQIKEMLKKANSRLYMLRNSNYISLLQPCRTERFRKSPIPYFIDLLNNRFQYYHIL